MSRRLIPSAVSFPTTAGPDKEMVTAVPALADIITAKNVAVPVWIKLDDIASAPADLTITQAVLRATKRKVEVAHEIYPLTALALKIATVMKSFDDEGTQDRKLTHKFFAPDHGLELVIVYQNPTTLWNTNLLWDIDNDHAEDIAARMITASRRMRFNPGGADTSAGQAGIAGALGNLPDV